MNPTPSWPPKRNRERALAEQSGLIYILSALIDEVNDSAVKMRKRILKGELLPVESMRR